MRRELPGAPVRNHLEYANLLTAPFWPIAVLVCWERPWTTSARLRNAEWKGYRVTSGETR